MSVFVSSMGTGLMLAGVSELPKCRYGDPDCYYLIRVCGANQGAISGGDITAPEYKCTLVSRSAAIEGSGENGVEKLTTPILAGVLGLLPSLHLTAALVIRNQKSILGLLEYSKVVVSLSALMLVYSTVVIDTLTFDCRWHDTLRVDIHGKNHPWVKNCKEGFEMYMIGVIILFIIQFFILVGAIVLLEVERKRMDEERVSIAGGTRGSRDSAPVTMVRNATANPGVGANQDGSNGIRMQAW